MKRQPTTTGTTNHNQPQLKLSDDDFILKFIELDKSQSKLAQFVGMSQQGVSKRLKKLNALVPKDEPMDKGAGKMTEEVKKTKRGRKPWVPDYEKIENWSALGLLDKEIAALSGIAANVFCEKKNELPELVEALQKGRARGTEEVCLKLLELVRKGDRDMIKFYLARRSGWTEQTGAQSVTVETGEGQKKTKITISDLYKDLAE